MDRFLVYKTIISGFSQVENKSLARAVEMTDKDFEGFCAQHREPTLKYAVSLGCRHDDAEDLVQEVLVEIWCNGQRCNLQTMIRQRVIKRNRRHRREVEFASSPDRQTYDTAEQVHVDDALRAVPDETDRRIANLRYHGASNAEIGRELNLERATIGKRIRKLRKIMAHWAPDNAA
jgi:RNA polymerase sigma factor (sigma-70 family)